MGPVVTIFKSFEEADEAECQRRADMTPEERLRERFGLFETHQVEYVLVGGFAVNYYGYVHSIYHRAANPCA